MNWGNPADLFTFGTRLKLGAAAAVVVDAVAVGGTRNGELSALGPIVIVAAIQASC